MVDMPLMAATAWAQAHAAESKDPVAFGAKVAQVYLAAEAIKYHGCKDTSSELEATILREAGFGEPTPPKNGGNAEAEGAAQPHKPTPPSPIGSVAALYEAMQQGAADAVAATQRAEEARSEQNAQRDVVLKVLATPLNARAADALAAANKGQVIRTPVAPAAALAALSGWLGAAGKTILASLSTWREPRASRSSGRNPK
jgi:hypothetical protein